MRFRHVSSVGLACALALLGLFGLFGFAVASSLAAGPHTARASLDARLYLEPDNQEVVVGQPFSLTVRVDSPWRLKGFSLTLEYHAWPVSVTAVEPGPFLSSTGRTVNETGKTMQSGRISYSVSSLGEQEGPGGSGWLATISGQAQAIGQSQFVFQSGVLETMDGELCTLLITQLGNAGVRVRLPVVPTSTRTTPPGQAQRVFLPIVLKRTLCALYEPNNDYQHAYPLAAPGTYTSYLCAGDSDDWYVINLARAASVSLELTVPTSVDYDLYLYRQVSGVLQLEAKSDQYGHGVTESISYPADAPGPYYIRVFPYEGRSDRDPYILRVSY